MSIERETYLEPTLEAAMAALAAAITAMQKEPTESTIGEALDAQEAAQTALGAAMDPAPQVTFKEIIEKIDAAADEIRHAQYQYEIASAEAKLDAAEAAFVHAIYEFQMDTCGVRGSEHGVRLELCEDLISITSRMMIQVLYPELELDSEEFKQRRELIQHYVKIACFGSLDEVKILACDTALDRSAK